jgi:hypothetical protein
MDPRRFSRLAISTVLLVVVSELLGACTSGVATAPTGSPAVPVAGTASETPTAATRPTISPSPTARAIPSDPMDIVLRLDVLPDHAFGELGSDFNPGIDFTLYGDGTVILRRIETAETAPDGPVIRGGPFVAAHLDDGQVRDVIDWALDEGGLGDAVPWYDDADVDVFARTVYSFQRGDAVERVTIDGSNSPFKVLQDRLLHLDRELGLDARIWQPDTFHGELLEASSWIESGVLPPESQAGSIAWPWQDLTPADFGVTDDDWDGERSLSPDEAAASGLSDEGGVIERVYLRAPTGDARYAFAMWPEVPGDVDIGTPSVVLPLGDWAVTVSDDLRVRSLPFVGADSVKYEPLLPEGTELYVVDGPVLGSGFWWYLVEPDALAIEDGYSAGWVASADHDGTPWLAPLPTVDMPD